MQKLSHVPSTRGHSLGTLNVEKSTGNLPPQMPELGLLSSTLLQSDCWPDKPVVLIINIFILGEESLFRFWSAVSAQQLDPFALEKMRDGRGLVCCIAHHNLYGQMVKLLQQCWKCPAIIFVAGMYAVAQDDTLCIARRPNMY